MDGEIPAGLRFSIIGRSFKKQLDGLLREHELTGVQFGVLGELLRLEHGGGEITQRDLEAVSRVTHPTMTEILKRLERKGFVSIRPGELDRRCKCISSTESSAALCHQLRESDERVFSAITEGLSEAERGELLRLTDKMLKNICGKGNETND